MKNVPEFYAADRAAWRQWLQANHDKQTGVWLVYDKGSERTMQWSDIVQEALCFGWIDSLPRKRDDGRSMIYISKRKPSGVWSKINKAHVDVLVAANLMTPAGQKAIDDAKRRGTWDALNKSDNLEYPSELIKLFNANPTASHHFEAFSDSSKRAILQWIYSAKLEATMAKRIYATVAAAAENHKANEWQPKN